MTTNVPATGSPPGITEVGPNDSIATAQPVPNANTNVNAAISSSADSDYVRVSLLSVSRQGTGVVANLSVTNTGGAAATYYARVVHFSGGTGATNGKYALRLNW